MLEAVFSKAYLSPFLFASAPSVCEVSAP